MRHGKTSEEELNKMIDEATVDCYHAYEAFMGVVYYLAGKMSFPFRAKWLSDVVEVIGIDDEESSYEKEVMAQILTEEDEYTVSLDELELMPDDTENGRYLEMYEHWMRGFDPYEQD
jgi:energy-converting hydrogenase A subunit M